MGRAIWDLRAAFYDRVFELPFFKGLREKEKAAFEELITELELGDARVLDVACGTGYYLRHFDGRGSLYGVDISEGMLRVARNKAKAHYVLGDARALPFKRGTMNLVVCIGLLEYFRGKQAVLREIETVLKRDGYALISYSRKSPINALRNLCGNRVYQSTNEEMAIFLNNCSFEWVKERLSLLQGLVLCRKD